MDLPSSISFTPFHTNRGLQDNVPQESKIAEPVLGSKEFFVAEINGNPHRAREISDALRMRSLSGLPDTWAPIFETPQSCDKALGIVYFLSGQMRLEDEQNLIRQKPKVNDRIAVEYFSRAVREGYTDAVESLKNMYLAGRGLMTSDGQLAYLVSDILMAAARSDSITTEALTALKNIYLKGGALISPQEDLPILVSEILMAASISNLEPPGKTPNTTVNNFLMSVHNSKDLRATYLLSGLCSQIGNHASAEALLAQAAAEGNRDAAFELARDLYEEKKGFTADDESKEIAKEYITQLAKEEYFLAGQFLKSSK